MQILVTTGDKNNLIPSPAKPPLSTLSSAQWWCMAHPFLWVLQLFLHPRGKHQVDYYWEDFGGYSSFPMNFPYITIDTNGKVSVWYLMKVLFAPYGPPDNSWSEVHFLTHPGVQSCFFGLPSC